MKKVATAAMHKRRARLDAWFVGQAVAQPLDDDDLVEDDDEEEDLLGLDECIGVAPPSFRDPSLSIDGFVAAHGARTRPAAVGQGLRYAPTALGKTVTSFAAWKERVAEMERALAPGTAPPLPECVVAYVSPGTLTPAQEAHELSLGRVTCAILAHDAALRHGQRIEAKVKACFAGWGMPVPNTPLLARWRRRLWRAASHERTSVRDVVEQIEHDCAYLQFQEQLEVATAEAEERERDGAFHGKQRFSVRAEWGYDLEPSGKRQRTVKGSVGVAVGGW